MPVHTDTSFTVSRGMPRFSAQEESQFREFYDAKLRNATTEIWGILAVTIPGFYLYWYLFADAPDSALPSALPVAIGVGLALILRGLGTRFSPMKSGAALFAIAATYLDVGLVMWMRFTSIDDGPVLVPLITPVAILTSLIFVGVRARVLVPATLVGLVGMTTAQLLIGPIAASTTFQLFGATIIVGGAIGWAVEIERWTRIGWAHERKVNRAITIDSLTGLANRRHFRTVLQAKIDDGTPLSLLILDVDNFKSHNDFYGHPAGDDCLRKISDYLRGAVDDRHTLVARLGGEEFIVLDWSEHAPCPQHAAAIQRGVGELRITAAPGFGEFVTVSGGYASTTTAGSRCADDLFRSADSALYRAKNAGRNQLAFGDTPTADTDTDARVRAAEPATEVARISADIRGSWRSLRFTDRAVELEFREFSERQAVRVRQLLMSVIFVLSVALFLVQSSAARHSTVELHSHLDPLRPLLLNGLAVAGAVIGLAGCTWCRLSRWAPCLYIGSIALVFCTLTYERAMVASGWILIPLLLPMAILLSMCVAQIRYEALLLATIPLLAIVVAAEVYLTEVGVSCAVAVATAIGMAVVTLRFTYRGELSHRTGWLRARHFDALSRTDALTGLPNRGEFDSALRVALTHRPTDVSLVLIDVDHFKLYNDHFGHLAGDDCLRRIAKYLTHTTSRAGEFAARLGGEEFAVILSNADRDDARTRAAQIRAGISALGISAPPPIDGPITASAGCAHFANIGTPRHPDALAEALVTQADNALYLAKHQGRNRIHSLAHPAAVRRAHPAASVL